MSNRLVSERSAYLRQHADNPVDWWPWGEAAIDAAHQSKRPILLSIGYSACHWCHVMAHESFEDPATAEVMNALYVNIKLDRDDRPDLDQFYQLAHQALTGRNGGWPLTLFLDADSLLPFLAGTYFPPEPRHGLPAFVAILKGVRRWFDDNPEARTTQTRQLQDWFDTLHHAQAEHEPVTNLLEQAFQQALGQADPQFGGHQGAPKFPQVSELEWLLDSRDGHFAHRADAIDRLLATSLDGMARGGLQDHLGGGFFRYTVDAAWEIPHFEKMLNDNALLLGVYARAAHIHGREDWARVARRTAAWLERDMQLAEGGLAASIDADSATGEGAFYLWQPAELETLLVSETRAIVARRNGLDRPPNFEGRAWHLTARVPPAEVAAEQKLSEDAVQGHLRTAHQVMLAARSKRPPPTRDDKQVCAWNALAISALARASRYLGDAGMLAQAESHLAALRARLWRDGCLYRSTSTDAGGFLDDHAFLLDALLELLNCRWSRHDLDWAMALAEYLLDQFLDQDAGGFNYTARNASTDLAGPKPWFDDAQPSANGMAMGALLRLGYWLGDSRFTDAAEAGLKAAAGVLSRYPGSSATILRILQQQLEPSAHVLIRATPASWSDWQALLARHPELDAWLLPADTGELPGVLDAQRLPEHAAGSAWLCRGTACLPPVQSPAELATALKQEQPPDWSP